MWGHRRHNSLCMASGRSSVHEENASNWGQHLAMLTHSVWQIKMEGQILYTESDFNERAMRTIAMIQPLDKNLNSFVDKISSCNAIAFCNKYFISWAFAQLRTILDTFSSRTRSQSNSLRVDVETVSPLTHSLQRINSKKSDRTFRLQYAESSRAKLFSWSHSQSTEQDKHVGRRVIRSMQDILSVLQLRKGWDIADHLRNATQKCRWEWNMWKSGSVWWSWKPSVGESGKVGCLWSYMQCRTIHKNKIKINQSNGNTLFATVLITHIPTMGYNTYITMYRTYQAQSTATCAHAVPLTPSRIASAVIEWLVGAAVDPRPSAPVCHWSTGKSGITPPCRRFSSNCRNENACLMFKTLST